MDRGRGTRTLPAGALLAGFTIDSRDYHPVIVVAFESCCKVKGNTCVQQWNFTARVQHYIGLLFVRYTGFKNPAARNRHLLKCKHLLGRILCRGLKRSLNVFKRVKEPFDPLLGLCRACGRLFAAGTQSTVRPGSAIPGSGRVERTERHQLSRQRDCGRSVTAADRFIA